MDTGDTYSYTFTKPGTYSYYCTLHPFMKGKVVVTPVIPAGD
ncbi:MAG TPA: plastocyanin/azurin family copper-binding protein [Gammaproteobacteria bacterium]|nr:plastocyanin/azurin family copper-binding protein [Gammaproteobacteria bacterium]